MSRFSRLVLSLAFVLPLVAMSASRAEATAQEVFICTLKEGHSLDDLMKVASEFKASIASLTGGSGYQAQVLVPIASQDLNTIVWVGRMPNFPSLAAFNDSYQASAMSDKLGMKFDEVSDCQSRSFWQVHDVK